MMTQPTSEQLAQNVPPLIRTYIDVKISEAVQKITADFDLGVRAANETANHVDQRLAEIGTLEKTVRGMLGL